MIIKHLPLDSHVGAYMAGDTEGRRWSENTHLLADMHEMLQLIRNEQLGVSDIPKSAKRKIPKFSPVDRPVGATEPALQGPPNVDPKMLAYLNQFAPPQAA